MELKPLLEKIKTLPVWARIIVVAVVAAAASVYLFTSCSVARVNMATDGKVSITTNQSVMDSTHVNISVMSGK